MASGKKPGRLARWATSTKNMMGIGFAVVGPALGLAGVVNPLVGVALAPALYLVGVLAAPGRKRGRVNLAEGVDPRDVTRSLNEIQKRIRRRVPDDVWRRVRHMSMQIEESIRRAHALGDGSVEVMGLVRTATDYLPTALQAYIDLPRPYADRQIVADGKTSLQLLREQLKLMSEKVDDIAEAILRADTDKLIAHGRFLAEKFGKNDSTLDI